MASWYRSYGETLNDPKVQRLSLEAFKAWHNALYLACSIDSSDGNIGNIDDVSFAFRETKESVSSAFHELCDAGLIETVDETFHIVAWKKRQYKSDTSTDRVKKYRAKMKRDETVTVTAPDTDTDTDKKIEKKVSFASDFNSWWERYPNKVGKVVAEKAYSKARGAVDAETLNAGLTRYIASKPADRAWCNPSRWLNQQRWEDQPAQSGATPTLPQTKYVPKRFEPDEPVDKGTPEERAARVKENMKRIGLAALTANEMN